MCDEQLPDGVMRMYEDGCGHFAESDECVTLINTPRDIRPVTVVEGHGRVREMYAVVRRDGTVQAAFASENLARGIASDFDEDSVCRVIVIEMDNAATPQE